MTTEHLKEINIMSQTINSLDSHINCLKENLDKYPNGEIKLSYMAHRNYALMEMWPKFIPLSEREIIDIYLLKAVAELKILRESFEKL